MNKGRDAFDRQYVKTHLANAIPIALNSTNQAILVKKETLDGAVYDRAGARRDAL